MSDTQDWKNLADHLERRVIDEMGKTWTEFERMSGVTTASIRKIRNGTASGIRPETARRLEVALGWVHGSIRRCLNGGKPSTVEAGLLREPDRSIGSPKNLEETHQDIVRRWANFLGQPFTTVAFTQLIEDLQAVQHIAARKHQDAPNE